MKKNRKKIQKKFRVAKVIKRKNKEKTINYILNGDSTIVLLLVGLIKTIVLYKNELFSCL